MVNGDIKHYEIHSDGSLPKQDVHNPGWRALMTNMQKYMEKVRKKYCQNDGDRDSLLPQQDVDNDMMLFLVISQHLTSKEQV